MTLGGRKDDGVRTQRETGGEVRRSQGQMVVARALWYVKPSVVDVRTERLPLPRPGEVRIKTCLLYTSPRARPPNNRI